MKILVVDDDKTMRMVLCHLLKQLDNFELIEANDGTEAWKLLNQGLNPDLCMIDILMPGMDGLDLLQKIRFHASTRYLKVIICSSAKERERIKEASSLDVSGYVIKPFAAKYLQAEVTRVLKLKPKPLTEQVNPSAHTSSTPSQPAPQ